MKHHIKKLDWYIRRRVIKSVVPKEPLYPGRIIPEDERLMRWLYYFSGDAAKEEKDFVVAYSKLCSTQY